MNVPQVVLLTGKPVRVDIQRAANVAELRKLVADRCGTLKHCVSLAQQCTILCDEAPVDDIIRKGEVVAVINQEMHGILMRLHELGDTIVEAKRELRGTLSAEFKVGNRILQYLARHRSYSWQESIEEELADLEHYNNKANCLRCALRNASIEVMDIANSCAANVSLQSEDLLHASDHIFEFCRDLDICLGYRYDLFYCGCELCCRDPVLNDFQHMLDAFRNPRLHDRDDLDEVFSWFDPWHYSDRARDSADVWLDAIVGEEDVRYVGKTRKEAAHILATRKTRSRRVESHTASRLARSGTGTVRAGGPRPATGGRQERKLAKAASRLRKCGHGFVKFL